MNIEQQHKADLEFALDNLFPKGKCKERSSGLMLYATAIIEHEKIMASVRLHLGRLLGLGLKRGSPEYKEAEDFYDQLTKN